MSLQAILLPVFVQVGLTFALLFWLVPLRGRALGKEVHPKDIALGQPAWPRRAQQVSNCFSNQFELPVLFYVLVTLAYITHQADYLFVVMSWIFVITRLLHAYIHTGSNVVRLRGGIYGIGLLVLIIMWIIFAVRVLAAY